MHVVPALAPAPAAKLDRDRLIGKWIVHPHDTAEGSSVYEFRPDGTLLLNASGVLEPTPLRWSVTGSTLHVQNENGQSVSDSDFHFAPDGFSFTMDGDEFQHYGTQAAGGDGAR